MCVNILRKLVKTIVTIISLSSFIPSAMSQSNRSLDQVQRTTAVDALLSIVKGTSVSARYEYHGTCLTDNSINVPFVNSAASEKSASVLEKIQRLFRNNQPVTVREVKSGLIFIDDANIRADIFEIKLEKVRFSRSERYNPNEAISALLESPSARSGMHRLNTEPMMNYGGLGEVPAPSRPHLSSMMKDVKVGEAISKMLATFGGVVVYEECTRADGSNRFKISLFRTR